MYPCCMDCARHDAGSSEALRARRERNLAGQHVLALADDRPHSSATVGERNAGSHGGPHREAHLHARSGEALEHLRQAYAAVMSVLYGSVGAAADPGAARLAWRSRKSLGA